MVKLALQSSSVQAEKFSAINFISTATDATYTLEPTQWLLGNEKQAGQAKFKCLGVRNTCLLQRPEVATSLQVPGAGLPAPQLGT